MDENDYQVATIVLAAGYSSRTEGDFKPLLRLGGTSIVERVITSHLDAGIKDIRLVVGYRADEVIDTVKHLGIRVVRNRNFREGMFSSIQAGVATLDSEIQAFFIMPVDIPLVDPRTIQSILDMNAKNNRGITYPVYRGRKGHPPLITRRFISEILVSPAPDGLRGILNNHKNESCEVEVDDEAILMDIDTMEDYIRLQSFWNRKIIPNREQCMELLHEASVEEPIQEHCRMVAVVACQFVQLLNNAGAVLNMELVQSAALLHDVKRSKKDHARAGARFLRTRGYGRVAEIVAVHMDIEITDDECPTEAEIVYLADKLVSGRYRVPLQARFNDVLKRYEGNEIVRMSILRRKEQAETIKKKVERIIGCTLEEIPPMNMTSPVKEN